MLFASEKQPKTRDNRRSRGRGQRQKNLTRSALARDISPTKRKTVGVGSGGACSVLSAVCLLFAQSIFCSCLSPFLGFCVFSLPTTYVLGVGVSRVGSISLSRGGFPFSPLFLSFFVVYVSMRACVRSGGARVCFVLGCIRIGDESMFIFLDCLAEASSKSLSHPL